MSKRHITHFFSPASKPGTSDGNDEQPASKTRQQAMFQMWWLEKFNRHSLENLKDVKLARWLEQFEWMNIHTSEDSKTQSMVSIL